MVRVFVTSIFISLNQPTVRKGHKKLLKKWTSLALFPTTLLILLVIGGPFLLAQSTRHVPKSSQKLPRDPMSKGLGPAIISIHSNMKNPRSHPSRGHRGGLSGWNIGGGLHSSSLVSFLRNNRWSDTIKLPGLFFSCGV